jgi:hypothetical protein
MFSANNTDTDNIESKKKEQLNEVKTTNWKQFAIKFSKSFLVTICLGVVVFGACGLYTAKVAESNILPSDLDFAPYTNKDYTVDPSASIFMNIIKIRPWNGFNFWDDPTLVHSQEATFIKEDFTNSWLFKFLCFLDTYANSNEPNEPKTFSNLSHFLHSILKTNLSNSFGIVNTIYSLLYKLPEWVVMLFYFTVFPFIGIFLLFYNGIRALITHLGNTTAAFSEFKDKQKWEDISLFHESRGWLNFFWVIIVFIFYVIISFYLVFFMSCFTTIYSLFTPLMREYNLKKSDETYGFGTFLRDTFVYKKSFILFLTAYTLLNSVNTYLNNSNYIVGCIIAILILAIGFNIFNPTDPTNNDITQIDFTGKTGEISKIIKTKQVATNDIDCTVNKTVIQTPSGFGTQPLAGPLEPTAIPLPPFKPLEPFETPLNPLGPLPQLNSSVEPLTSVYNEDANRNQFGGTGGGKKHIPRKLNKDGTSHKKYDFKLT